MSQPLWDGAKRLEGERPENEVGRDHKGQRHDSASEQTTHAQEKSASTTDRNVMPSATPPICADSRSKHRRATATVHVGEHDRGEAAFGRHGVSPRWWIRASVSPSAAALGVPLRRAWLDEPSAEDPAESRRLRRALLAWIGRSRLHAPPGRQCASWCANSAALRPSNGTTSPSSSPSARSEPGAPERERALPWSGPSRQSTNRSVGQGGRP